MYSIHIYCDQSSSSASLFLYCILIPGKSHGLLSCVRTQTRQTHIYLNIYAHSFSRFFARGLEKREIRAAAGTLCATKHKPFSLARGLCFFLSLSRSFSVSLYLAPAARLVVVVPPNPAGRRYSAGERERRGGEKERSRVVRRREGRNGGRGNWYPRRGECCGDPLFNATVSFFFRHTACISVYCMRV